MWMSATWLPIGLSIKSVCKKYLFSYPHVRFCPHVNYPSPMWTSAPRGSVLSDFREAYRLPRWGRLSQMSIAVMRLIVLFYWNKGPSIYDVHMEGVSGSDGRMWTGRGRGGFSSKWTSTQKILKLEPTDVCLPIYLYINLYSAPSRRVLRSL